MELLDSVTPSLPHVICLTEHHCKNHEIASLSIRSYSLAANFCRTKCKQGGTCIFVHDSLPFSTIDLKKFCLEQDIEESAISIALPLTNIVIICIYRSPTGNFTKFIKCMDRTLNHLTKPNTEFIICGDFNVDFSHKESSNRQEIDTLLATYNLTGTVNYPTRCTYRSSTNIDNIFIDLSHKDAYSTYPIFNGLSDHDGQLILLDNLMMQTKGKAIRYIRDFCDNNIQDFNIGLSLETWENVFDDSEGTDVNQIFNNFHNTFLRIFYSSFPKKKVRISQERHSPWLTKGLRISIKHKRDLYMRCKYSNDQRLKKPLQNIL
jgi:hypothetical protein